MWSIIKRGDLFTEWRPRTSAAPVVYWLALLCLCSAYLQGGLDKAADFSGAVTEMEHFGVSPAAPFAIATIVTELGGSALILTGFYRWTGALLLASFTLMATFIANRFWEVQMPERFLMENAFFEHLGLVGGFVLVAGRDLAEFTKLAQLAAAHVPFRQPQ